MDARQAKRYLAGRSESNPLTHVASKDKMLQGLLEAILWAETDGSEPLDETYSVKDFDSDTVRKAKGLIEEFSRMVGKEILNKYPAEALGNGLWLTLAEHGAGFWDGDYPEEHERILMDAVEKLGRRYYTDVYVSDDNKVVVTL